MKDISEKDLKDNIPLVTRKDFKRSIKVGRGFISKDSVTVIAGPCTVENRSQIFQIAESVKKSGATMLRGGIFKPLTFPYGDPLLRDDSGEISIEAVGVVDKEFSYKTAEKRLSYLREAGEKYDLPVISEILYSDTVEMMSEYVDMFQIGYRHMFNMDLIETLAKSEKPIMIKRHYGESLRSLLGVGEHFEVRGKHNFVFCERGISVPHTHHSMSRAVLDIQAIAALNEFAPTVPVFADPSHSTFRRNYVPAMSRAAISAGADGLLIEVHNNPINAWVDPLNAIGFNEFYSLMGEIAGIASVMGKAIGMKPI